MIHVMPAPGLGGAAMSAPVIGYDAIAVLEEEQHLRVPIIGRQRPAVAKHDGLTFAPVLVEDLNAVFGGDRVHVSPPLTLRAFSRYVQSPGVGASAPRLRSRVCSCRSTFVLRPPRPKDH